MRQQFASICARYILACALIVISGASLVFILHTQKADAATPAIKIMPLGDSITGSPGCWRALLWNHLQSTGYTNINFVGTLNNSTSCGVAFDGDNEGHGGYLATNIANQNLLPGWLSATTPDIVMMHLGTNDVWNNIAPSTILAAYSTLVDQMRVSNAHMKILVAQILPMNPSGCSACAQRVIALNNVIPGWASSKSTAQSPIVVVDQWTGFNDSADTVDGVHPNSTTGIQKVAARWYSPLTAMLSMSTPTATPTARPTSTAQPTPTARPTSTPTPTPTPTATPTPTGNSSCKVGYSLTSQWTGGFTANVSIANTSSTAINGWTLKFSFSNGQTITQIWSGQETQSGGQVTVTNLSYNGSIAAGGSTSFGFNGSWTGSNSKPMAFTLNGVTCSV